MENCLVTKLKGIVSDPDKKFDYFGGVLLTLYNSDSSVINTAKIGAELKARFVDGDAHFVAGASDSTIIEDNDGWIVTTADVYYKATTNNPVRVLVTPYDESTHPTLTIQNIRNIDLNKYKLYTENLLSVNLTSAFVSQAYPNGAFLDMKTYPGYFDGIRVFVVYSDNANMIIDLSHLSGTTSIATFAIRSKVDDNNIIGSLANFGSALDKTRNSSIELMGVPNVNGSVEDFAAAFKVGRDNGKTATLKIKGTQCTYINNGVTKIVDKSTITVTVDSSAPNGYTITW